jgi:hypothetical protein
MNIQQLPPELICHISDFLGVYKVALSLTCKQFNNVLERDVKKIKEEVKEIKNNQADLVLNPNNGKKLFIYPRSSNIILKRITMDNEERSFIKKYMKKLIKCKPEIKVEDRNCNRTYLFQTSNQHTFLYFLEEKVKYMNFCRRCKKELRSGINEIWKKLENKPENKENLELIIESICRIFREIDKKARCYCVMYSLPWLSRDYKVNKSIYQLIEEKYKDD